MSMLVNSRLSYRDFIKENEIKVVENKPLTKGDSIFQRIIEPYKGNVLFVDFCVTR